jgi:hypothetical protein
VLDLLAGRIRRAAHRAEGLVEIGDRFRCQAARVLLGRAGNAVDLGRLEGFPLAGAQAIRAGMLGRREHQQRGKQAGTFAMSRERHRRRPPDLNRKLRHGDRPRRMLPRT